MRTKSMQTVPQVNWMRSVIRMIFSEMDVSLLAYEFR